MKTWDKLFLMYCDDIKDMDLTTALESLMDLFVGHVNTADAITKETLRSQCVQ